ncbi:MAG: ABC transporter substrate-binding protein [Lachnospiraceae bacterium]|nr:ABC transporter substrate-binding protein [Lachnospiraceae bacterium]
MKRIVAIILTLALVAGMTACTKENAKTDTAPTQAQSDNSTSDNAGNNKQDSAADTGNKADDSAKNDTSDNSATNNDTKDDTANGDAESENITSAPTLTGYDVNIGVLSGPTGIGAVGLMDANDNGKTLNKYTFTVAAANDEIVAGISNGSLDIAAVATNVGSNLYNKTSGAVQIIALNTYGVLYILENGNEINSIADLKGKTIYCAGQGANPEYVIKYLLEKNGLTYSDDGSAADVALEFMDPTAITTGMASGEYKLCMLPVPAVTSVKIQNADVRTALDLTAEWEKTGAEGALTMGCVIVRKAFAEEHPGVVETFLAEYKDSISFVLSDIPTAGDLCEKYAIVAKAPVAKKAIPECNLCCVTGDDVRKTIEPYYNVLFSANPKSIGGAMPGDDFYYSK